LEQNSSESYLLRCDIEKIGVVKMDFLALPILTVIGDTLRSVKRNHDVDIDLSKIDRNDPAAFAMLRDGRTIGTFQLESPAQREMAGRLLPNRFEDVMVSIYLVRPGSLKSNMDKTYLPRRDGKKPVTYLHHQTLQQPYLSNQTNQPYYTSWLKPNK
jgi:DNA polymerase III alpha subunit